MITIARILIWALSTYPQLWLLLAPAVLGCVAHQLLVCQSSIPTQASVIHRTDIRRAGIDTRVEAEVVRADWVTIS